MALSDDLAKELGIDKDTLRVALKTVVDLVAEEWVASGGIPPMVEPTAPPNGEFISAVIATYLGRRAKDKVTGFAGVIGAVSFDLPGCIQCVISPPAKEGVKYELSHYFDIHRIEFLGDERVMPVPDYASYAAKPDSPQTYTRGPADKPPRRT